ncbi:MAG: superoxide dismutase family protein [Myxococcota bacterium]
MLRGLGLIALVGLAAGCNRKQDDTPQNTNRPEVPMMPHVDPARPAPADVTPGTRGALAEQADTPSPTPGSRDESALAAGDKKDVLRKGEAKFKAAPGYKLSGDAKLEEGPDGVKIVVELDDAPVGKRGIHIHEKGDCSDIPNKSMGEHFAPGGKAHALPPNPTRHLGDLGNIEINKDGDAHFEFTARNANLKEGDPMSFLGRAIVVHESEDKGTQPSGASGKPIACAVIEKD